MKTILYAVVVSGSLSFTLGFLLGFFKKIFHVEVDETLLKLREVLPGVNCGGCGYPGCDGFAEAVLTGEARPNGCPVGKAPVAEKIAVILKERAEEKKAATVVTPVS